MSVFVRIIDKTKSGKCVAVVKQLYSTIRNIHVCKQNLFKKISRYSLGS